MQFLKSQLLFILQNLEYMLPPINLAAMLPFLLPRQMVGSLICILMALCSDRPCKGCGN